MGPPASNIYFVYAQFTTGPNQHTLVHFWRLVWQERPPTIAMVTNVKEDNKIKCERYWPEKGSANYGPFEVSLSEEQTFASHTIRTMTVSVSLCS